MDREFEFRIWNKKTRIMVDPKETTPLALNIEVIKDMENNDWDGLFIPFHKDLVIMQFTGLLDKNGKRIFEGDIVLCEDGGEYFSHNYLEPGEKQITGYLCEIFYWDKICSFWLKRDGKPIDIDYSPLSDGPITFTLKGNVWDDEHLLGKDNQ